MRKINKIVMTLAGLLLIVAAVMKFHEMLTICVPSWATQVSVLMGKADGAMPLWKANLLGFWESYEFLLIQLPLEFALGVWMVSGLFRKAAWIAGSLAYFGFIIVTLAKAVMGLESCGCFGRVEVDPWITLWAVDVPFFLLLAIFRPKGLKLLPPPWPNTLYLLAVAVPTIGLMVLSTPALVAFRPECVKAEAQRPDDSAQLKLQVFQLNQKLQKQSREADTLRLQYQEQLQTLDRQKQQIQSLQEQVEQLRQTPIAAPVEPQAVEPAKDTPQPEPAAPVIDATEPESEPVEPSTAPEQPAVAVNQWDWLDHVVEDDIRGQLSRGLVVILMYHHDCPDCVRMAPRYDAYYNEMVAQGNDAFKIAFLAIPPYGQTGPVPDDTACIHGKLTTERKWEVTSPYVVALLDGELMKTWPQGTAPEPENILDEIFAP
jgi:TolA-binding protein